MSGGVCEACGWPWRSHTWEGAWECLDSLGHTGPLDVEVVQLLGCQSLSALDVWLDVDGPTRRRLLG